MTWWLLTYYGEWVYESNPVANWFLANFGWIGITAFKLVMVAVVLGCACGIGRRRPRLARRILAGACLVLAGVVFYSCCLVKGVNDWSATLHAQQKRTRNLRQNNTTIQNHRDLFDRLAGDLICARSSFKEAVMRLELADKARYGNALKIWKKSFPNVSRAKYLGCALLAKVRLKLDGAHPKDDVMYRLRNEYKAVYGADPAPANWITASGNGL